MRLVTCVIDKLVQYRPRDGDRETTTIAVRLDDGFFGSRSQRWRSLTSGDQTTDAGPRLSAAACSLTSLHAYSSSSNWWSSHSHHVCRLSFTRISISRLHQYDRLHRSA